MRLFCAVFIATLPLAAVAAVVDSEILVEGQYLKLRMPPHAGAVIDQLSFKAVAGDLAGQDGLLQEGFGTASPYVPNRRLNERIEVDEAVADRPVFRYSYDCDGPNITGFHVTRTIEPLPNEASILVRWRVENKGQESQWMTPWVRNDIAPGGKVGPEDRIDVPGPSGVTKATGTRYVPAARNWIAATDPIEQITLYGVYNADQTHAFLAVWDPEDAACGFQTAFVPRLIKPGETWETTYRLNAVRGLKRIDFAAEELAAQVTYSEGVIEVLIAAVKPLSGAQIYASVVAENGRRWKLDPKKFDADPSRVIRCSFEWKAPADGAYDFLAELRTSPTQPLSLNKNMATPHGGIDTQFVVGQPKRTRRMEPWTDAPYLLERGVRTLKRATVPFGEALAWIESPVEKVFRNDAVESTGAAMAVVHLARNERESFQVVVRAPEKIDLTDVNVGISDLIHNETGAVLSAKNFRLFNVAYYTVRVPSFYEGPTGEWPDALMPFKPFTVRAARSGPVWITLYAPPNTPAGGYTGAITISADDTGPATVPIEVTVYDFDLPVTPALKTDFGFWPQRAVDGGKEQGNPLSAKDLMTRYLRNALEHRVTLRDLAELPPPATDYAAALRQYESIFKSLLESGVTTFSVPASLLDNPAQLAQADAFVAAHNIQNRAFCHIAAEPPEPTWPKLVERFQLWKDTAPHIPLMVSAMGLQPFLPFGVDIWTVHTQLMDTPNNQPILERVQQGGGKEVWWYVNQYPPRPYANFLIDFAAIEHRILFWQAWALGIKGLHYWGVNCTDPAQNPYTDQLDATPTNGDGCLVYPGAEGPVDSVRWEVIRDGIEDYDYLVILAGRLAKLRARPDAASAGRETSIQSAKTALDLKTLVPDLVTFPRDPQALLTKRDQIANAIVTLGR